MLSQTNLLNLLKLSALVYHLYCSSITVVGDCMLLVFKYSLLINDGLWNATLGISIVNNSSTNHQLCFPQDNIEEAKKACDDTSENNDDSWSVLIWFILANVLTGIADACTFVLGMTYIDANASKEKLPLYLGTYCLFYPGCQYESSCH